MIFTKERKELNCIMNDIIHFSPMFGTMDNGDRAVFLHEIIDAGSVNGLSKPCKALLKELKKDASTEMKRVRKLPFNDPYGEDQMCYFKMPANCRFHGSRSVCPSCGQEDITVGMEYNDENGKETCPLCGHENHTDNKTVRYCWNSEKDKKEYPKIANFLSKDILEVQNEPVEIDLPNEA